ncbi:hypothetical protein KXX11_004199, partial [Aspergillus fumigatus]
HEGQPWQDLDLAARLQIAEEGQAETEVPQLMAGLHRPIVEIDRPIRKHQVVEREVPWLVVGRRGLGGQLDQVIDVVVTVIEAMHRQHRTLDDHGVDHRRQPEQGLQFSIYIETPDAQLGSMPVAAGQGEILEGQFQAPGFEIHMPD